MLNISYCVTVCNELSEITQLINFLQPKLIGDDEILIQYDSENTTDAVKQYLEIISNLHKDTIRIIEFPLNNDFSSFKNNLKEHAKGIYIFQCDADEMPAEFLIDNLHDILDANKETDLFYIPRINTVEGLTLQDVQNYGWNIIKFDNIVDEKEMVVESDEYKLLKHYNLIISETDNMVKYYKPVNNFPDYQSRLYRRSSEIHWENKVHEVIVGFNTLSPIPAEPDYCLYHPKTIDRQRRQNDLYETIK